MKQYTGFYTGTFEDDIYSEKLLEITVTIECADMGCVGSLMETIGRAYNWELYRIDLDGEEM